MIKSTTSDSPVQPPKVWFNSAVQLVTVVLLVVGSFLLGSLWQKVQFLEKGGTLGAATGQAATGQAAPKKYQSIDDAMKAVAKSAKVDGNQLVACMNSGEKKAIVDADASQASAVGVTGTPGFFVNGRFLGGAYPYEAFQEIIDKELSGNGSDKVSDYSQTLQTAAQGGSFDPKQKSVDIGNAPIRGNSGAAVTIIEFSDFQCPYCSRAFPTMEKVLKEYEGKVRLVYKHLPLSFHQYAQKTAEASECARDQGKFWEFHDELFKQQSDWSNS